MSQAYEHLIVEPGADIYRVTINRPGDRNSMNSELMAQLGAALDEIEATEARAVIFTGAGGAYFIGGADGIEMMQCDPDQAHTFSRRIQALYDRLEQSPLIMVAAINGLCFGGGFEFALACDLRLAAESARLGLPEVKVGLIPGGGGTQRLPALVGPGLATEMILTGKLYSGVEAARWGLVHRVTSDHELPAAAEDLLRAVLRQPQYALTLAKRALKAWPNNTLAQGLAIESEEFSRCFERDFFMELMKTQLAEGVLQTTAELPPGWAGGKG
ncbi:MAG: enoyl-CoA hydratase/isomerase family protein [Proteobacteria bacterium]|nr:enoyl-CoA hydratase/isomerase family protein [Pseudomonadota bacterium]